MMAELNLSGLKMQLLKTVLTIPVSFYMHA